MKTEKATRSIAVVQRKQVKQILGDEPLEPLLSIKDVMRILNVSRRTVYSFMHNDGLPHIHLGKSVRFSPVSLRRWMLEHEQVL